MNWRKHKFVTTVGILVLGSVLAWGIYRLYDPSGSDINDMRWTEQIELASGKTVSIERHVRFQEYSVFGTGGSSSGPVDEWDSLSIPDDPTFVLWAAPVRPMLMDRDPNTKEWILIAHDLGGNPLWGNNGKPCPPHWAFRLRGGKWYIQPVPTDLLGRLPNLLVDLRVSDDAKFSGESFPSEMRYRKLGHMAGGQGAPYGMKFVGDQSTYKNTCATVRVPAFMGPFRDTWASGTPIPRTLTNFPRLP